MSTACCGLVAAAARPTPISATPAAPPAETRARSAGPGGRGAGGDPLDVQQDPHRQPRRDRAAHPARLPPDGHHRRSSPTARPTATRCAVQLADEAICVGPAESATQLPVGAVDPVGRARDRLRGDPSGLRLPVRGRHVRGDDPRPRPDLHRAAARGAGAIRLQGRHTRSCWQRHGLPTIPGSEGMLRDDAHALAEAERIGYPVLIKPSAGGGGRGMRMVRSPRELQQAITDLPLGGARRVRRRLALPGEVARGEPPRRGPGHRRPLRQRRPRRRARLLASSAATRRSWRRRPRRRSIDERRGRARRTGDRAPSSPPATRTWARSSSWSTAQGNYYFIEINCRIQVEHPRDGDALGHRPRRASRFASPRASRWATRQQDIVLRGHAHRVPHQRRGRRARLPAAGRRGGALPAARRARRAHGQPPLSAATRCRRTTIRCSASSSCGAPTAPPPSPARASRSTSSSWTGSTTNVPVPPGAPRQRHVPRRARSPPTCSTASAAPPSSRPRPDR